MSWYRDKTAVVFLVGRYLPIFASLNVAWEIAQLPLYTLWREATAAYIAFAVAHCTAGDILIGTAAFVLALTATRARSLAEWRWASVAALTTVLGLAYTAASEWMNTTLREAWQYSEAMPTIGIAGVRIGLSPLAQWLAIPPLALYLAKRSAAS